MQAVQLAIEHGVAIGFDETAQSPYFNYIENGVEHEVCFEHLVKEFSLRGMGYWQLMRLFLANWILLDDEFDIL